MSARFVLDVFSDYICPWCYLGTASVARLRQEHDLTIRWVHYPLHPDTPANGIAFKNRYGQRSKDQIESQRAAGEEFRRLLDDAGLPQGKRTHLYNSRLAQELSAWGATIDAGDALHDALFAAYFVDNLNLSDRDVLCAVAKRVGLPAEEARTVLDERRFRVQVDDDWNRAYTIGVTGVPAFWAKDLFLIGCQPDDVLDRFVSNMKAA